MRTYIAIDLKSFYASVECVDRGLDPLNTNLVVADKSRTDKTICLAVSPPLKAHGVPGRPRLFEVVQKVRQINADRRRTVPGHTLLGSSVFADELSRDPALELDYIVAPPQMARYMKVSTDIFQIYLKYVAPEDIHVYSVDEVFMDVTEYLTAYHGSAHEMAMTMVRDVLRTTGITATAGIGTNLYLCKVAMDIVAKHMPADKDGVRVAELDEMSYRRLLWEHKPITDFWRVGHGYAGKLAGQGLYTMGDVARFSMSDYGEDTLYRLFGVNAELLIDHAWGWEPCLISDIKAYRPQNSSLSSGQVLSCPTAPETARLIVWEMADMLALDLVEKGLVTDSIVLTVGYDVENLKNEQLAAAYTGEVKSDYLGRRVPKHAHGTIALGGLTSSSKRLTAAAMELFDRIYDLRFTARRLNIVACNVVDEGLADDREEYRQLSFFSDVQGAYSRRRP